MLTSWSSLLWILGTAGVPVILNGFYGARVAGLVGLVQMLIGTPLGLLSTSTTKVFVGEAAKLHRSQQVDLRPLFWNTLRQMTYVVLPLILVVAATAPWVIPLVFGEQWRESSLFLQILAPMFFISTVCLPTFGILNVLERQDLQLVCDLFRIPLMLGPLVIGGAMSLTPAWSLLLYSLGSCVYYFGNTAVAHRVVKRSKWPLGMIQAL